MCRHSRYIAPADYYGPPAKKPNIAGIIAVSVASGVLVTLITFLLLLA